MIAPRDIQRALVARGFNPGPLDGKPGPKTRAAVAAFQAANGLSIDGIAGTKTLVALGLSARGFLNSQKFAAWAPSAVPNTLAALEAAIGLHPSLQHPRVLASWLGQMWVESAGFSRMVENLNYSVDGLLATFGRHRISATEAARFGRSKTQAADQRSIANTVYGGEWGRKNLGNTQPNDGWDMRGSGFKQITGRDNTVASGFSAEQLRTDPFAAAAAAAEFFIRVGCVPLALADDQVGVTRKINGGQNAIAERIRQTGFAKGVIA